MMNFNDKKVQKKVIKLISAIRRSSDSDLVLLNALATLEVVIRDEKNYDEKLSTECQRLMAHISDNQHIMSLLMK